MPDARRRRPLHRGARLFAVAALSLLAACDKGTCAFLGAPPYVVPRVNQGSSVTYVFSAYARSGGVPGGDLVATLVDFSLDDATATAINVSPNPVEIEATRSGQVTFHASRDAAPGQYTVRAVCRPAGESSGGTAATFLLEIEAATFFSLNATPNALTLDRGEIGSARIDIVRDPGFFDPVSFAISGVPPGAAVGMNTGPTTGSGTGLNFSPGTAAAGNYTLTIAGSGAGRVRTATLGVEIRPEPVPVDWNITATPMTITIPAGSTGQIAVAISRTNFPNAIEFYVDRLPNTIPTEFTPQVTTGNGTVLMITVPAATPLGQLPFEIVAISPTAPNALNERGIPVALVVVPPMQ